VKLKLSLEDGAQAHEVVDVGLPLLRRHRRRRTSRQRAQGGCGAQPSPVPAVRLRLGKDGDERDALVATVFDLQAAQYGIDRGLGRRGAKSYDDDAPYTPAWQEKITGVPRDQVITVARQFADNADKTHGKSMVIIGAAMNHWYHADMNYRGVINLLMMCGCVGQSGGGWAHYVGQEKLRPQTGWTRWPSRSTGSARRASRTAPASSTPTPTSGATRSWAWTRSSRRWPTRALRRQHDRLQRARRAHGLAAQRAAAQDQPAAGGARTRRPPAWTQGLRGQGAEGRHAADELRGPGRPAQNWPRNLFVWRSNLLGSSGKGHEYFCKHLLGTENGVQGKDLGKRRRQAGRSEVARQAPRASSTCW
jgi:nitrate reductase / nitrite oxidoreductase, alpha subunit